MQDFKHLENPVEPPIYLEDVLGAAGLIAIILLIVFLEPILDTLKAWVGL